MDTNQLDKISLTEAIVALMSDHYGFQGLDATNAIPTLRKAQANLIQWLNVNPSGAHNFLHKIRPIDDVDQIIITATQNGARDLFE